MLNFLSRIEDPILRARKSHQYVSQYTNEVLNNPIAKKFVTCHRGCSACCHTQVSVNADEAQLLASKVINNEVQVDLTKLYIQGNVENNSEKWFALPYDVRGCVFLDDKGACTVYEDRPSVCRTNNVLSPPKMCETRDGVERPIRLLNTEKADMAIIASYEVSGDAGTLPSMLWKAMKQYGEPPKVSEKSWSKKVTKKAYLSQLKKDLSKIFEV
ncbi:YkgJ family cysteine cluster protein [Bacteriovorax sp. Seq25_V]|uniref:YkgJ family cysteine cluster protein n=1 Tax=Bacteriovorax sp. Seq25_V TaxID=1201288 RepID=UPI000389FEE0|nr:YkgJ family cysteine cluster protein [Bacteriovorax sp. Seq25_V]EQC47590.1 flagellin N-methylase [Bacteriovorax sp. Seq25_V]